jgi:hypothetical protein
MTPPEFLSLFDYLSKPAGNELGLKVYEQARLEGIPVVKKDIEHFRYKGKVNCYPVSFLNEFFKKPNVVLSLSGGMD